MNRFKQSGDKPKKSGDKPKKANSEDRNMITESEHDDVQKKNTGEDEYIKAKKVCKRPNTR